MTMIDAQYVANDVSAMVAELVENHRGINPRNFFCVMQELPNDAVKFCIGLHQLATVRNESAIVVIQGAKWYLTLSDWRIWLHPKGRADITNQLREYVSQMYNHIETAEPIVLS